MRKFLVSIAASVSLAAACSSAGTTTTVVEPSNSGERAALRSDAPVGELANGFNNAGFDLLRTLPADENLVFSPASIGHALLMARAAADEPTGTAIDDGFSLPPGMTAHEAWNTIGQSIEESNGAAEAFDGLPTPTVAIADRIWPRTDLALDQAWVDVLASHHGADVETIDVNEPEESRARINSWVADQTNQLIPELLPTGFINSNTKLVLTDAVYFKAQWRSVFGKYGTVDGQFNNLDGSTTSTAFMRELETAGPAGSGNGWAAVELPYAGDQYAMLVIVPDDFEQMRGQLSHELISTIDASIANGPYELLLPKWETDFTFNLVPWLVELGAAPGEYPAMGGAFIDGAVHAAVIGVDEIGTEAAAATALGFAESGPPEPEFTIAVDRPFYYLIRHRESGLVLFAGQVASL